MSDCSTCRHHRKELRFTVEENFDSLVTFKDASDEPGRPYYFCLEPSLKGEVGHEPRADCPQYAAPPLPSLRALDDLEARFLARAATARTSKRRDDEDDR